MVCITSVIPEEASPNLEQLYHQVSRLGGELSRTLRSIQTEEQSNHSFRSDSSSWDRQSRRMAKQRESRRRRDTPQVPRVILTPPTRNNSTNKPSPGQSIWLSKVQSFKEKLDQFFPPYVHPALAELGGAAVEDAYHLTIDDLTSCPQTTRVQARKIHALVEHHLVHRE